MGITLKTNLISFWILDGYASGTHTSITVKKSVKKFNANAYPPATEELLIKIGNMPSQ